MEDEPSEGLKRRVQEIRNLQHSGKDYMYCKMWLVANGYDERSANYVWALAKHGKSLRQSAEEVARKSMYDGLIFLGGFLGSLLFFRLASFFNFFVATVFGYIFLRYSKFAVMRSPFGFAMSMRSDLYHEPDPPEKKWFNYGVMVGFAFFFVALFYFPSFLGWTPSEFWFEFTHPIDLSRFIASE
ncbi:hypothetical protein KJ765_06525 [Candidatus Micrarchaeota archaeon]|nr:hypothetical protein [Candidatus Micrarchaeota archaeon]